MSIKNPTSTSVGVTAPLAGSNGGFTIAVFRAVDVPPDTPLYVHPAEVQVPSLEWLHAEHERWLAEDNTDGFIEHLYNAMKLWYNTAPNKDN